ncbi:MULTISPECIES: ArpU family phage packaging/lysis transcriptional regulator [Carnobacterium]|uniref:Putative transcriptional regulator, ArpU family n=1 Tax=Carnobacterium maltaromaticum TaxID=2751 RepID=A0A1Z5AWV1_CARML|nr:transcriptional regulator, ArpU family protein [Carnobacterium maltaromaticum]MCI1820498.1 transcriptional regulator, ArpU family protein [Carnobacterium maltaromaticum]TFJ69127.1 hypothetical protein CKN94_16270 [Carnobacterium maltaromaticum]TFJ75668.1 hypothetical protein CKN97_16260 [Carnobacterium maltaromaticum]CRI06552.1 putative transcriptional regulator, ArpU family [Carnobacterium maltaromaticum]
MQLFDIRDYELPSYDEIDWKQTKHNVGIFIAAYKTARERVGQPILPKLTSEYTLVNFESDSSSKIETNTSLEIYQSEYERLHKYFVVGYSSIIHPYRPEITERRRKIFMLRYFYGLTVSNVSERIHYQKNIVVDDSKKTMLQFSCGLSLLVLKK